MCVCVCTYDLSHVLLFEHMRLSCACCLYYVHHIYRDCTLYVHVVLYLHLLFLFLEMAGKGMKPKMELAYTTSDLYHLPDLSPSSWANLVERYTCVVCT